MTDEQLMRLAIEQAKKAAALGEVPVGAVVAKDGEPVAMAYNTRETGKNATHHAELLAIDAACKALGGWRLWQCELFVTLEPCLMCAGAIMNARLRRVVYGAADDKTGALGGRFAVQQAEGQYQPEIVGGVCGGECAALLKTFFASLRERTKERRASPAPDHARLAEPHSGETER